jgi:hypothetical protein
MIIYFKWVATAISILGNFVLIYTKSWIAFVVFFLGNLLWAGIWIVSRDWPTLVLIVFFLSQNILGLLRWRKMERISKEIENEFDD